MGYPLNCLSKSALHFQPLRVNHFNLGTETDWFLLTFLISFPGSCEPIFRTSSPRRYPFCGLSSWFWCVDNNHLHSVNHHTCSFGFSLPTCPAGFLFLSNPCGLFSWILALSNPPLLQVSCSSLPDSSEPTCWLPLHFQPFRVFYLDSDVLMMLLLQETLTIHLVFRATLSNLFHRFPLHFQPLRAFHVDFSFVRPIICKLPPFITRFLRTDLLTSSPCKPFQIYHFDSDDSIKTTFASCFNISPD